MVDSEELARALPWRTFRWHRGQAHYSGWYWSSTMAGHVVYESRLELARLLMADFDPLVRVIAAQPFLISGDDGDRTRRHVPDFLMLGADGVVTVVNVKPARRLADAKVATALTWAGEVFACRGWRHEVWSGAAVCVVENVRYLAGYRHAARVDVDLAERVNARVAGPMAVDAVLALWPGQADPVRAAVLHLLWRGRLSADLSSPLSGATVVERAA